MFKLKELKHGSKFKKLVEKPDHEKIVSMLIARKGRWETTKKNPHKAINRGPLTEEAKVWLYFITSIIVPTKHLCSVREQEAIILYALLRLIEGSILGYHLSNKRGLIPHPATITRLCILAGVKGRWEEEETCPRVSPLTMTRVIKGLRNRKQKELGKVKAESEEENDNMEIENFLEKSPLVEDEEMQGRMSPLLHSCPNERENFLEHAKSSKRNEGTAEIMEMLVLMRKDMEEREKKWERQQQIREELLEADLKKKRRTTMGAEFKAEGRRVERRVRQKGEGMARKDEGHLGSFLQQSIQKRF